MKKQLVILMVSLAVVAMTPVFAMIESDSPKEPMTLTSILLKSPPSITEKEVEERTGVLSLEMKWSSIDRKNGQKSSLGFNQKNGRAILCIQFENEFPQDLAPYEKQFILSTPEGKKIWTFTYGDSLTNESIPSTKAPPSLEEAMGIVHTPRILEKQSPKILELSEVAKCLRDKRCVFYTGAGISAGVVPTIPQLMKSLQLAEGKFIDTLQDALKNPSIYIQPMEEFYKACLYGEPTLAHKAIRDIVQKKEWGLLTENLDLLHQRTGINPLHHDGGNWLKSNVSEEDLKQIDYVITVGLASDESGFLGWYKAANPKGTIIAINLQQSNYLGEEDLLLTGDVQQLLPALREKLF
ncbi:MAG: hypothetical protein KBD90_04340 [Alphaproteobacteria bacterium]|nr:hypothetical protein [Alphaproteobacteria bacterium]